MSYLWSSGPLESGARGEHLKEVAWLHEGGGLHLLYR